MQMESKFSVEEINKQSFENKDLAEVGAYAAKTNIDRIPDGKEIDSAPTDGIKKSLNSIAFEARRAADELATEAIREELIQETITSSKIATLGSVPSKPAELERIEKIKLEIPKIIIGAYSDSTGEKGALFRRGLPKDIKIYDPIDRFGTGMQNYQDGVSGPRVSLKHIDGNIFFAATSPNFTNFESRHYSQTCLTWLPDQASNAGVVFSQFKQFKQYTGNEAQNQGDIYAPFECEIEDKKEEISFELLNVIKESLKAESKVIFEFDPSIFSVGKKYIGGNKIFDVPFIKQMLLVYDKLTAEEKERYSLSINSISEEAMNSKFWVREVLKEQREDFEKNGYKILKLEDYM